MNDIKIVYIFPGKYKEEIFESKHIKRIMDVMHKEINDTGFRYMFDYIGDGRDLGIAIPDFYDKRGFSNSEWYIIREIEYRKHLFLVYNGKDKFKILFKS